MIQNNTDLTTIPSDIYDSHGNKVKTKTQFEDWAVYENTEFRADENYNESWADVDKLKHLSNEVYLITLNAGSIENHEEPKPFRKESQEKQRYTFAFDYAVANISESDLLMLHYYIMKYRNTKIDDQRTKLAWNIRAMIALARVEVFIEKFPHVVSHFS